MPIVKEKLQQIKGKKNFSQDYFNREERLTQSQMKQQQQKKSRDY
jgi:hypothetical protein